MEQIQQPSKKPSLPYVIIAILALALIILGSFILKLQGQNRRMEEKISALQSQDRLQEFPSAMPDAAVPFDPVLDIEKMQARLNHFFETVRRHGSPFLKDLQEAGSYDFFPAADVTEKEDAYIAAIDLPGLEKDKIEILVRNQQVIIQGERASVSQAGSPDGGFVSQERSYGAFRRVIPLPGPVQEDAVAAVYQNGVLQISLPKSRETAGAKKIAVS